MVKYLGQRSGGVWEQGAVVAPQMQAPQIDASRRCAAGPAFLKHAACHSVGVFNPGTWKVGAGGLVAGGRVWPVSNDGIAARSVTSYSHGRHEFGFRVNGIAEFSVGVAKGGVPLAGGPLLSVCYLALLGYTRPTPSWGWRMMTRTTPTC